MSQWFSRVDVPSAGDVYEFACRLHILALGDGRAIVVGTFNGVEIPASPSDTTAGLVRYFEQEMGRRLLQPPADSLIRISLLDADLATAKALNEELLEACHLCVAAYEHYFKGRTVGAFNVGMERARAAIAKAEGRS